MPQVIPNLHPLMVHFPVALITVAAIFHVAAITTRNRVCAVLAHTTLWLGALGAVAAVFFGWQAFNSVNHDEAGHVAMLAHRAWALSTLAVLALLAGWDAWRNKVETIPNWWLAGATLGAWAMVAVTAWHGGELVYRHGLGVMALPVAEAGHEHHHDHGDGPLPTQTDEAAPAAEDPAHDHHEHHEH